MATGALTLAWAAVFGYLAIVRHLAGGSHAEDLGWTEQVLWNFRQGQWFRMSIYNGATWNTELDLSHLARPDSLLAFHFEPMLLALVPLYAVGGALGLLALQALALAAGAIPAYRLAGVPAVMLYLLSPLGQWAALSDFHTSTLAAPLLLLALERLLVAQKPAQALGMAALALTAREDVGPVVAVLGLTQMIDRKIRKVGVALAVGGTAWTILALLVIRAYSGGVSPFDVRYGPTLANPLAALTRQSVEGYATTLLLSGGWLGLLSPLALLPTLPTLALNALSTSPWMASGKAHYSAILLPFITFAAAIALSRIGAHRRPLAVGALMATSIAGYLTAGAGPLAANFAPAQITQHAATAERLAASLPTSAGVSASTSLVPRVADRTRVYVFPAINDADFVFLDTRATPAPTSARDVFLRTQALLTNGWRMAQAEDGLLILERGNSDVTGSSQTSPGLARSSPQIHANAGPVTPSVTPPSPPTLVDAELVPSPDGAVDVDGPRWILRTTWRTDQPLASGTRPEFWITQTDGDQLHVWDIADVWWNPPDAWPLDQAVTIDVPDIPVHSFKSWSVTWTTQ